MKMNHAKDLSKEAPRSPRVRLGGFVIFGRTIDKCRADLAGQIGDYHYDCPLDNILFGLKGVTGDELKAEVERGLSDEELVAWLHASGDRKSEAEIKEWSDGAEKYSMSDDPDPEKRAFFAEECGKVGLDPAQTTLFEWLEMDDRVSFKNQG